MSTATKTEKYIETIGRRKTATARVRLSEAKNLSVIVNDKPVEEYFPLESLVKAVLSPLTDFSREKKFTVTARVTGGGISAQAEAVRHGIARALTEENPDSRPQLKKAGYLKRDPRKKERRKFGLKKARKAPQWSKR